MAPIWAPSPNRLASTNILAFAGRIAERHDASVASYDSLYRFSVTQPQQFWAELWDYLEIVAENSGPSMVGDPRRLRSVRWFPEARLNFAENLLRRKDDGVAIVFRSENGNRRYITWHQLGDQVIACMDGLRAAGVRAGDRVAGYLPNVPEAVIAMLATTALGAIWSACSPDYGVGTCLERLQQVEPAVLFAADGYFYRGQWQDLTRKTADLAERLPSLKHVVWVPYDPDKGLQGAGQGVRFDQFCTRESGSGWCFEKFPFDHAAFILFSSGTTGAPKCIVHGAGGTLLQTLKELALQCDVKRDEKVFYLTTTGWMVWNVMVAALGLGAPIVLYDGSPVYPQTPTLFDLIDDESVSAARIVPKLLDEYARAGLCPRESHRLTSLKCVMAGSEPLLPHHYRYVYEHIKEDIHLMSPAGGTDIMATLASGNPAGPVYPGEIQARALGMKVEVFDDQARSLIGQPGELVCTQAFPSVPLCFWGDTTGKAMHASYFGVFPGIWRHGDWAEITPRGGVVIYGRSDATLNVNGVRIGTSEIYRTLQSAAFIRGCAAVERRTAAASEILLFVELEPDTDLADRHVAELKELVRKGASARHVPAHIFQVPELPRSSNGKVSEAAIRDVVNGRPVKNSDGLLNPHVLASFRRFAPTIET